MTRKAHSHIHAVLANSTPSMITSPTLMVVNVRLCTDNRHCCGEVRFRSD